MFAICSLFAAHRCAQYLCAMGKYVTITQLAKELELSHSTVSRALNNNLRISEATRMKVQAYAKSRGYFVNSMAHQLSRGKSMIIGVIIPDLTISFYSIVLESLQKQLQKEGYSILLFNTRETLAQEVMAVETCLKHRVDGIIAAISIQSKTFDHFEKVIKHEIPLIFFDRVANFLPVPKVIANDHLGAYNATQYLIKSGCKNIAHITGSINLNNSNNRLYGYLDALKDHDMAVDESVIHYYEFDLYSIDKFLSEMISKKHIDGLFVFNDYVANYAINYLSSIGAKVPEDVSVFGFSDEPIATYSTPQISTVEQVGEKMGLLASQKMVSILNNNESFVGEKIVINPKLEIRDTTRS